jgi:hypothetical protein
VKNSAAGKKLRLLETAKALMFPQPLGQHGVNLNASVVIHAKEGRRNDEDC